MVRNFSFFPSDIVNRHFDPSSVEDIVWRLPLLFTYKKWEGEAFTPTNNEFVSLGNKIKTKHASPSERGSGDEDGWRMHTSWEEVCSFGWSKKYNNII